MPESEVSELNLKETELTLGLPGESRGLQQAETGGKITAKRGYSETVDLKLGSSSGKTSGEDRAYDRSENDISCVGKQSAAKAQVVGWPPVRSFRRNVLIKSCTYVKVAVDGTPYLRKVDLEIYGSYEQLLKALEEMFSCFTVREEGKLMDPVNGVEYVPTYEDKDGDWMLVGDVPWKMFVESCNRIRLMKSSEATGLAPRTPSRCTSSS